jgi:hypothetical protein
MEARQVIRPSPLHFDLFMLATEEEKLHKFFFVVQVQLTQILQLVHNFPDDVGQSQYDVFDRCLHGIEDDRHEFLLDHLSIH